jgi:pSer/pThr/pTyr-binding forkhead associated (FHA) protein
MAVTFSFRADGSAPVEGGLPAPVTLALPCVRIGSAEACDFRVRHPSVSLHHATLEKRGGLVLLRDEGSEFGTELDGVGRLAPGAEHAVRDGAVVRLGAVALELRFAAEDGASSSRGTAALALRLVDEAFARGDVRGVVLSVRGGPGRRKEIRLREGVSYVVGRGRDADMMLEDLDVSRHHAVISLRSGDIFVRDLGSSNGTHLGSVRLAREVETLWPSGPLLRLGGTSLGHERALDAVLRDITGFEPLAPDEGRVDDGRIEARGGDGGDEERPSPSGEALAAADAVAPLLPEARAPVVEPPSAVDSSPTPGAPTADPFGKWLRLVILPLAAVVLVASLLGLWWVVRF